MKTKLTQVIQFEASENYFSNFFWMTVFIMLLCTVTSAWKKLSLELVILETQYTKYIKSLNFLLINAEERSMICFFKWSWSWASKDSLDSEDHITNSTFSSFLGLAKKGSICHLFYIFELLISTDLSDNYNKS